MALPDLTDQLVADSYKGVLHTSNIPVSGSNLPPVYDGLGNKSALSVGSNGVSINGTLSASAIDLSVINSLFPIGSVLFSVDNVNPSGRFIGSTWERIADGRFVVGVGTGNDGVENVTFPVGNNGGTYKHQLSVDEMPAHSHNVTGVRDRGATRNRANFQARAKFEMDGVTSIVGNNEPHENTPPGFGLFIWQRTS